MSLGDLFLALQIEEQLGEPVPTVRTAPTDHSDRRVKAANTILFDEDTATDSEEDTDTGTDDELSEPGDRYPIGERFDQPANPPGTRRAAGDRTARHQRGHAEAPAG